MATIVLLTARGSSAAPKQGTLEPFLAAWSGGDWVAMRTLVADPPAKFAAQRSGAQRAGGEFGSLTAGRVRQSGAQARRLQLGFHA